MHSSHNSHTFQVNWLCGIVDEVCVLICQTKPNIDNKPNQSKTTVSKASLQNNLKQHTQIKLT